LQSDDQKSTLKPAGREPGLLRTGSRPTGKATWERWWMLRKQ